MRPRHERGTARRLPAPYDEMLITYATALAGSPLAASSRANYLRRVRAYLDWLAMASACGLVPSEPLADTVGAVRTAHAYHGQLNAHYAPRTINNVLAAIEDFYTHLHLGATGIPRERAADAIRTGSPPE